MTIGAAAYYMVGSSHQWICQGSMTKAGKVVEICGPPEWTDLLPFALVVAVLLAPDFSELGVPGLLSIKRRVATQEGRQQEVESKLARIEQNVEQRVAQNQESSFQVQNIVDVGRQFEEKLTAIHEAVVPARETATGAVGGSVDAPEAKIEVGATEEGADDGVAGHPAPAPTAAAQAASGPPNGRPSDEEDRRASLTLQLLWLAKNLEQYEAISRLRRVDQGERTAGLTEDQQERVDRWYDLFEHELGAVKQVSNAVSHNPYAVSLEELQEADRIGSRLLRILMKGIGVTIGSADRLEPDEPA